MILSMRFELFVGDVAVSTDFYEKALGFKRQPVTEGGYLALESGAVEIGFQAMAKLPPAHGAAKTAAERWGRGIEIVLETDDLEGDFRRAVDYGATIETGIQARPWGLTDFRLMDPDGFYIRVTTKA